MTGFVASYLQPSWSWDLHPYERSQRRSKMYSTWETSHVLSFLQLFLAEITPDSYHKSKRVADQAGAQGAGWTSHSKTGHWEETMGFPLNSNEVPET